MRYIVIVLLFISSCERPQQIDQFDRKATEKEVQQMLHDYFDAIRKEGLQAEFEYLDDSDDFFWVPPGYESALSYDSVKAILLKNGPTLKKADFKWEKLRIIPLSNQIASYTGIVESTTIDTANNAFNVKMIETGISIKRPDGWKILSGQSRLLPEADVN